MNIMARLVMLALPLLAIAGCGADVHLSGGYDPYYYGGDWYYDDYYYDGYYYDDYYYDGYYYDDYYYDDYYYYGGH